MIERFAIIIGAMKAGTTSLFSHLSQHPQICPSDPKEPEFFSNDENWERGLGWYESHWDWNPAVHTIALEASTNYTKAPIFPDAAARMAGVDREFRLIYLMRDPIRRIESQYNHGPKGKGWKPPDVDEPRLRQHVIDVTRYATQLDAYYERFEPEQILLLAFEDLISDPMRVVQDVCRFLGVSTGHEFKGLREARNVSSRRVDHPIYERATNSALLQTIARILPARTKEAARKAMAGEVSNLVRLSESQRQFCLDALRDDLVRLERDYGFDVSRWNVQI